MWDKVHAADEIRHRLFAHYKNARIAGVSPEPFYLSQYEMDIFLSHLWWVDDASKKPFRYLGVPILLKPPNV